MSATTVRRKPAEVGRLGWGPASRRLFDCRSPESLFRWGYGEDGDRVCPFRTIVAVADLNPSSVSGGKHKYTSAFSFLPFEGRGTLSSIHTNSAVRHPFCAGMHGFGLHSLTVQNSSWTGGAHILSCLLLRFDFWLCNAELVYHMRVEALDALTTNR